MREEERRDFLLPISLLFLSARPPSVSTAVKAVGFLSSFLLLSLLPESAPLQPPQIPVLGWPCLHSQRPAFPCPGFLDQDVTLHPPSVPSVLGLVLLPVSTFSVLVLQHVFNQSPLANSSCENH